MTDPAPWLESMLSDIDGVPPPPRLPYRLRGYALRRTWTALRLLRAQGRGPAHRYLRDLAPPPSPYSPTRWHRRSRSDWPAAKSCSANWPCEQCLRAECAYRSLSLGAYLSAIGLPAEAIIARERTCTNPRYACHSWTELYGEVLNDNPDVTIGFSVMQRVRAVGVGFEPTVA
ncbi:lasso peptide biosynthesis protein [Nocardia pseudobrasiliensis]|uniref:lasso peptide biosynthesis protein n=1 Tax=Nocardia pseudobrasiliensis TaxID=45979 RepID=UPI0009EEA25D|nr:lasso peptide biosynthesis protein [Nocardia pseudobrasiliensis]